MPTMLRAVVNEPRHVAIGETVTISAKLQEFMKGEKKSLLLTKEFAGFKIYPLSFDSISIYPTHLRTFLSNADE